jgi:FkbM family methyltransferase
MFAGDCPEHQWEGKYRLREGDVYVEAGAFWGRYGLIASRRVGEKGKVILIEPHPFNISMIKNVIQKYNLSNVTLIEAAVWSSNGIMDFCVKGNPAGAKKAVDSDAKDTIIKVQAYTLDDILTKLSIQYVDLLAADVEGAEVEMVRGAEKYLTEHRIKNLAIAAYHKPEFPGEIMKILKTKGYKDIVYNENKPHYGGVVYASV